MRSLNAVLPANPQILGVKETTLENDDGSLDADDADDALSDTTEEPHAAQEERSTEDLPTFSLGEALSVDALADRYLWEQTIAEEGRALDWGDWINLDPDSSTKQLEVKRQMSANAEHDSAGTENQSKACSRDGPVIDSPEAFTRRSHSWISFEEVATEPVRRVFMNSSQSDSSDVPLAQSEPQNSLALRRSRSKLSSCEWVWKANDTEYTSHESFNTAAFYREIEQYVVKQCGYEDEKLYLYQPHKYCTVLAAIGFGEVTEKRDPQGTFQSRPISVAIQSIFFVNGIEEADDTSNGVDIKGCLSEALRLQDSTVLFTWQHIPQSTLLSIIHYWLASSELVGDLDEIYAVAAVVLLTLMLNRLLTCGEHGPIIPTAEIMQIPRVCGRGLCEVLHYPVYLIRLYKDVSRCIEQVDHATSTVKACSGFIESIYYSSKEAFIFRSVHDTPDETLLNIASPGVEERYQATVQHVRRALEAGTQESQYRKDDCLIKTTAQGTSENVDGDIPTRRLLLSISIWCALTGLHYEYIPPLRSFVQRYRELGERWDENLEEIPFDRFAYLEIQIANSRMSTTPTDSRHPKFPFQHFRA